MTPDTTKAPPPELLEGAGRGRLSRRRWPRPGEGSCHYCGRVGPRVLDHVEPLAAGGRDEPGNLVPACEPCNSHKGARTPEGWTELLRRSLLPRGACRPRGMRQEDVLALLERLEAR